jgi:acyl-CoA synthetase (AMP-forming)/AMP-acid ligase II/thioesterase domain-containing protein/acyl carrier protein
VKTLNAMGFCRNDRIAVILPGGPETGVASLAVMAGFTSVPLNPEYKEQEFAVYFSKMKIRAILVKKDSKTAARAVAASRSLPIIELIPSPDKAGIFTLSNVPSREMREAVFAVPSDVALLMQTSGTTALPKIVPNSQQQLCMSAKLLCTAFSLNATERSLHIVPFYHAMGILGTFLSPLLAGGTVICPDNFVASDFLPLLKKYRLTHYSAGPALHQGILREIKKARPEELKDHTLRFIRSTSASLPAIIHQELESVLGVPVIESYGMSEAGLLTVNLPQKRGSVGISVVDSLAVIDENGNRQKPCEQGEIVIQGESVFSGYENAPAETRTEFIDGWFKTGDIGYLDDEGYLYLTGRKSELINKGGEKISPAEIDNALMTHPSVKSAMTFRVNNAVLGEDIAAMVVLENPDTSEEELRTYLIDRLIQFKVPKRIYFVDEIPRGSTGKPLRYVGTERYTQGTFEHRRPQGRADDTVSPELTVYQEKLLQIWKDILDTTSLSLDDDFFRCGGNSLAAIELLIKIQRAFNLTIPPDTIYRYPTIRQQALIIAQKTGTEHFHPLIVPIRTDGTLPPLFCFHSIGGWIGPYQNIFQFFNQDRPVFGIRAKGLEPGEKPWLTIDEAVREYADAIKTVQKEGPYYLLGYSAGALYAFELACQLQSRGESVVYLGNIDQSVPVPQSRESGKVTYLFSGGKGSSTIMAAGLILFHFLNSRLKTKPDSILYSLFVNATGTLYKGILYSGFQLHPAFGPNNGSAGEGEKDWISTYPEKQQPLLKIHRAALRQYKPRTFLGNLTLFSTGPDWSSYPGDRTRGWKAFTKGKTIIIDLPGMHSALFLEPFAHVVAQKIEESLKRVDTHG